MTHRSWMWHGKFLWALIGTVIVSAGILVAVFADDEVGTGERIFAVIVIGVLLVILPLSHSWITVSPSTVRFGFFPLYRRTLQSIDIAHIRIATVRPVRDFAGWGARGLAKSKRGLLLGGNPPRGVRFQTRDNRTYTITLQNIDAVVSDLERNGFEVGGEDGDR